MSFLDTLQARTVRILRWSEKYTKTDMVYLAQAGFWSNLNFIIVSILALLLSIVFANFLPKDVYGTYQYLISLSALITALTLAGMNTAVARSVARGFEGDLRASVRIQFLWSVVPTLIGLLFALYYFWQGNLSFAFGLVIIALLSPITNVFNTYAAFLQGKREFKRIFTFGTSINLVYYAAIFLCVLLWRNALVLVFANLVSNAIATAFFYFRTLKVYRPNNNTDSETITYGAHLSIMNTLSTVVAQLDSVLVFHFLGPAELAVYSFATMFPERIAGLSKFLSPAGLPKFANRSIQDIRAGLFQKFARAILGALFISILYIVLAPALFHLLFPTYGAAILYSQIYSPVIITTTLIVISTTALFSQRLQRELYIYNVVSPVFMLVLQVVMIISYGLIGILLARIISGIFNIILSTWLFFKTKTNTVQNDYGLVD